MSYIGTNSIGKLLLGTTEMAKAYLGTQLVYQSGGGPTPPVVTPVFYDYLYFDGAAYIETTYVLPANCSIRVFFGDETSKTSQQVFGANGTNGGNIGFVYGGSTNATRRQMVPFYDSSSYLASNRNLNWSYTGFSYFMTPYRFGWGNATYTYTKGNLHPDGGVHFGVYSIESTATKFTGKMGQFRIYGSDASGATVFNDFDNYSPVATFRPCTYNGEAGLWYVEGNTFFGNSAGTGTLTASNS